MSIRKVLFTASCALTLLISLPVPATDITPGHGAAAIDSSTSALEAVVDAQLVAYNRRDVEEFLSFYSDDAKLFDYPNRLTESGKDQLRTRYQRSFSNKDIRASIVKRIVFDRFVIDHERITGRPDGIFEAIAVYEIKDGKIVAVTFFKH